MILLSIMNPTKQEFDDAVNRILQRPDYSHLKNFFTDLIERIRENIYQWLIKMLSRTFADVDNPLPLSENLSTIFMIIGILAILALIIIIILRFTKTLEKNNRIREILGEKIDEKTTPGSLRKKAFAYKQEGELRQAIRYEFIALLLLMHERNYIYLEETKTNEEIFNYLRKNKFSNLNKFKNLIDTFNSSWYGHKVPKSDMYENWSNNVNHIWNEVISFEDKVE